LAVARLSAQAAVVGVVAIGVTGLIGWLT